MMYLTVFSVLALRFCWMHRDVGQNTLINCGDRTVRILSRLLRALAFYLNNKSIKKQSQGREKCQVTYSLS